MTVSDVLKKMENLATHNPKDLAGMARFGINVDKAWVISIPNLRKLGKEIGKDHNLAQGVWDTGIHEAKILAGFIDDPTLVTKSQMEKWVLGFNSWDVTDMVCGNLFDRTSFAYEKAIEWSKRKEEYVKRAGFVLMAGLAVHDKNAPDDKFYPFLERIMEEANDERNFVRKANNWALRQIGKSKTKNLYIRALRVADDIMKMYPDSKSARWIACDAIRELTTAPYILKKFGEK
jgi:3-methyladenine DNA glycosylase AlkD